MTKKTILIAGGAGFIGSHLCRRLFKENRVICLDNFISGSQKNVQALERHKNFKFTRHDITILELAKIILEKIPETKSKIIFKSLPKDDPTRRCPDINRARKLLGWKPEVGLEKGLEKTIGYFRMETQQFLEAENYVRKRKLRP